ncbi:MAG: hypothetical protein A3H72_00825 [Candidatus Doudnabacteria bacterium RIFCSPLOWO2_02_FULL_48_8]|nr:MAG: hypothetical protein A3H72_00825 [Candidatus Doudnabacteria bacterium RIFCSPLOWO2_02_FULL_48_8]
MHYNVIYGADLVSSARLIYAIPAASLLILILNILAAAWLVRREKLAAYFLNFSNIAIQAVFFAASLSLIAFND